MSQIVKEAQMFLDGLAHDCCHCRPLSTDECEHCKTVELLSNVLKELKVTERSLGRCVRQMHRGRPSFPDLSEAWDRALTEAERVRGCPVG